MRRLILRNLLHYWRINAAVVAGVATGVAVLAGALVVGQSVRDSLRALLFERLGATDYVVSADRFFREDLASVLAPANETGGRGRSCPIIALQGVLVHEGTGRRAHEVHVYGIDERFWAFHGTAGQKAPGARAAVVGAPLAAHLGVGAGDTLLLRIETGREIPGESLYGRRESIGRTIRLTAAGILPPEQLGEFVLGPGQGEIFSVFVPLRRLQQDLGQPSRVNAVLLAGNPDDDGLQAIRRSLKESFTLADVGVRLRPLEARDGLAVESSRILLDEAIARAAFGAAADAGVSATGVFTYLANAIRARGREIPYSVITAAERGRGEFQFLAPGTDVARVAETGIHPDPNDDIWLNEWAQRDLGVSPGDTIDVDYYQWESEGGLVTRTARFRLAGVVPLGGDAGQALAPDVPGITGAKSVRAWDPPFPLDLRRIRAVDEAYWNRYRATPKAFVTLARGQQLWQSRFGRYTSVRMAPVGAETDRSTPTPRSGAGSSATRPASDQSGDWHRSVGEGLRHRIDPESAGFTITPVRQRGLDASRGSVNLGEYFVYFNFFLIAAAVLLSALFFKLGVEQRVREIGTLRAIGFPMRTLRRIFLLEGAVLAVGGSLLGVIGALAYGGFLVFGLRTWWVGAVGTERLSLHASWRDLASGAGVGILASLGAILWTLRGLERNSPRALLSGVLESGNVRIRQALTLGLVAAGSFVAAGLVLVASASGKIPDVEGFFGAGVLLLVSTLSLVGLFLRRAHPGGISGQGWRALVRLGMRNATPRPGRSLLCIALIASATFIIVSVEAFRKDPRDVRLDREGGTGGYPLVAMSALPIAYDPGSLAGREALGIPAAEVPELADVTFVPFRVRPGDDTSCLNLYAPRKPRILGASHAFLAGGRFAFQESMASTAEQRRNPWLLLEAALPGGVIPAIGDANAIEYSLHLSVGDELTVRGGGGRPVRLRLVAALRDSILQGELVMSEANFLAAFPSQEGYRFFLLDAPAARAAGLVQPLTERLSDWGFKVDLSRERLAAYHRVENTYLSTFQSLGALGLVLGTFGLAAVLLRNVLERRGELALLRAVGYRKQALSIIIVAEHLFLMACGLLGGTICALVAITPAVHARGGSLPVRAVSLMLVAVLFVGVISSLVAGIAALRAPLVTALRSE